MDTATRTQHTPGPWHISELRTGELEAWSEDAPAYERSIYAADGPKIAVCEQWIGRQENAEAEANARLIAASPRMADALLAIARDLTDGQIERGETVEGIALAALEEAGITSA